MALNAPLASTSYPVDDAFHNQLDADVAAGFINTQTHPDLPLTIFNYTPKAQFSRHWTPATMACRGLVLDDDRNLVARPLTKFFNLEEVGLGNLPAEPFDVFEKVDGSLLIATRYRGELITATRGSFTSPQSQVGRKLLLPHADDIDEGTTFLFEVIYPDNRIVCDYGKATKLVALTAIDTASGAEIDRRLAGIETTEHHPREVIDLATGHADERDNREGYVLRFASGVRVKVKHDEYVRLHKVMTNISSVTIWEYLRDDLAIMTLLDRVPDEFYQWVRDTIRKLEDDYEQLEDQAHKQAYEILAGLVGQQDADRLADTAQQVRRQIAQARAPFREVVNEVDELCQPGIAPAALVDRIERWSKTKNPHRKAEMRVEIDDMLAAGVELDVAVTATERYLALDETTRAQTSGISAPLRAELGPLRKQLWSELKDLGKEQAGLISAVIDGQEYRKAIFDRIRPEASYPFTEQAVAA